MSQRPKREWMPRYQQVRLSTTQIASFPVAAIAPGVAAMHFCQFVTGGTGSLDVHLVNAYSVALASKDPKLRDVYRDASLVLPDGKPLAFFSRIRNPDARQVRGPAFFEDVLDLGRGFGLRHFLLGSTHETLSKLESEILMRFPGANIVGRESPPFRPLTRDELELQNAAIASSGADIVWVGLGTPKQDFEAQRLAMETGVTAVAVGAAFDFTAQTKPSAPHWMSAVGAEWVFRLASEPRRLWRRYLIGNAQFLWAVLVDWRAPTGDAVPARVSSRRSG